MKSSIVASKPISKRSSVTCVCDLRSKYEAKVNSKVKENLNKILVIGTVDFKMMYEILQDVDALHKEKFDSFMKSMKEKVEVKAEDDDTNENIFLEKN